MAEIARIKPLMPLFEQAPAHLPQNTLRRTYH
jgi:hypothetical protein